MINIEALYKSYGSKEVLKDIHLQFMPGTIYGIVGANGAGKSTLFRCIAGLEDYEGKVDYSEGVLKNATGFLETNPYMLSKVTGLEYLQLLCNARGVSTDQLSEKNVFDLPLERYASNYSTGMKKKLALTGILLQENEVFILDEPFNGVDIQSNIMIKEVLMKLKALNKIVLLSSHIFSTLNETCDHLHLIKDGVLLKSSQREGFTEIEDAMKGQGIGNRLDQLGLK